MHKCMQSLNYGILHICYIFKVFIYSKVKAMDAINMYLNVIILIGQISAEES